MVKKEMEYNDFVELSNVLRDSWVYVCDAAEERRKLNVQRDNLVNYPQTKDLWALDVEKSSCIGHDNNSHLSWVFTYPHVAMLRAALTSASATLPQCAQRKCLPFLMPM
jgi:hypothetical protein